MAEKKENKRAEQVRIWLDRIDRAKAVKKFWRESFRLDRAYQYFKGFQRPANESEDDWITLNMFYSTILAMLPNLYSTDPYFYVKLKRSFNPDPAMLLQYEQKARVRQAMLNYLKGELRMKPKIRLGVQDSFFQFAVMKVCHYSDIIENPDVGSLLYDENERPIKGDKGEYLQEPEFLPANESYKLLRIHPDDFIVDEDATSLDYIWAAQRFIEPLEKVRKDKRYTPAGRKAVKASAVKSNSYDSTRRDEKKKAAVDILGNKGKEADLVVMWELYDRERKEWFVVAEGCEEWMVAPSEIPEGIDGDPFVTLRFTLDVDSWYPIPPTSQWIDSQRELNLTRSRFLKHRKRFNRKYEVDCKAIGPDYEIEAEKLVYGDDGTIIMKNGAFPGVQAVHPIQDAPLDMQIHTEYAYIRKDFDDLAVGANQRGASQGIDSATEAGILEVRAKIREGDWRALVADFTTDIGRKLDQQVAAHITRDEAVRVVGPEGEAWELVRESDYSEIAGEYEYEAAVGSMTPQLPEIERAQWLAFLTTIGQFPQLALSEQLLKEAARMHNINNELMLKEIKGIAEKMMAAQAAKEGGLPPPLGGGSPTNMPGVPTQNPKTFVGGASGMANTRGGR